MNIKIKIKKLLLQLDKKALLISTVTYLIFFYTVVFNFYTVFWGSDMKHKFFPVRSYLYQEIVENHRFPFWTEKIYSGFPIYADIENAYLHPLNIVSTVVFGPILSYKILHFLMYLLGSYGLYMILRKKKVGYLGFFVSNLTLFFSFYLLNKQIHQSLILTIYTFPMSVYLLSQYMSTRLKKYIIWSVVLLSSAFYWGHPQIFMLYILGLVTYGLSYAKKRDLKDLIKYFFKVLWFVFLLSLPQLLPSLHLNTLSTRAFQTENISASQGSYNPLMFSTLFYPQIFLNTQNYQGEDINSDYSFVETYSYIGITTFILFLVGLVVLKDKNLNRLVFFSFLIYLFLSYSSYIPLLKLDEIPVLSLFRYWTRSSILFIFSVSLVVGLLIDGLSKQCIDFSNVNYKNMLYIPLSIFALLVLNLSSPATKDILDRMQTYLPTGYAFKEFIYIFLFSLIVIFVVTYLSKKKFNVVFVKLGILIIVTTALIDLRYFSKEIIDIRTDTIQDLSHVDVSGKYKNTRIIVEKGEIENNESLYYEFWWPYGYSQFRDKKYYEGFVKNNISEISRPESVDLVSAKYDFYKSLGIVSIISDDLPIYLNTSNLDIIKQDIEGSYLKKQEGNIKLRLSLKEPSMLDTYVKNLPGWKITVDGIDVKNSRKDLFISIPLNEGNHVVELKYVPVDLYYGLLASLLGFSITFFLFKNVNHIPLIKKSP